MTPDPRPVFHKYLTPGPKEKRRILPELTPTLRIRVHSKCTSQGVQDFDIHSCVSTSKENNIFYFIADLRSISQTQEHKKWLAIHQRTLQKRCLHITSIERSKALYPHHSCIVIRKRQEHSKWITIR